MNIIFKIILFNLILFLTLKYSLILFFILLLSFSFYMVYIYYNINNIIEGNLNVQDYKMNFVGILNDDIKSNFREDILYNSILDNFTKLLKIMDHTEGRIPSNQMCVGELGEWSPCTKECGRGKKTRRFNVLQKAGENGIKCIYENGQIESKECFDRLCKFNEECEGNFDCISGLCNEKDELCSYPHMCSRDQTYNCNFEQCQELNRQYGEYLFDENKNECVNKVIDIEYEEFEINEETTALVESEIDFVRQVKTDNIIKNIRDLCKSTTPRSGGPCNNLCQEGDNCQNVCGESYSFDYKPCIYNSDENIRSCESIEEHYDHLHNSGQEPYSDINATDLQQRYLNYPDKDTTDVFKCSATPSTMILPTSIQIDDAHHPVTTTGGNIENSLLTSTTDSVADSVVGLLPSTPTRIVRPGYPEPGISNNNR